MEHREQSMYEIAFSEREDVRDALKNPRLVDYVAFSVSLFTDEYGQAAASIKAITLDPGTKRVITHDVASSAVGCTHRSCGIMRLVGLALPAALDRDWIDPYGLYLSTDGVREVADRALTDGEK